MKTPGRLGPYLESDFKTEGGPLTYALAGILADELGKLSGLPVSEDGKTDVKITYSKHTVARQTAAIYDQVLACRGAFSVTRCACNGLTPPSPIPVVSGESEKTRCACTKKGEWCRFENGIQIVIGHQPQLTQIAQELLKDLPGNVLPLGNSEAACIRLGEASRLLWLITEKSEKLLEELKAKIQSKYDVAKFFLGALVVNTGLILNANIWETSFPSETILVGLATVVIFVSLGLTTATLFAYDRLSMPQQFWTGGSANAEPENWTVKRPPSQAHLILFYEMTHVWKAFFTPAIITAFIAIGLYVLALGHRVKAPLFLGKWDLGSTLNVGIGGWLVVLGALVAIISVLVYGYYERNKPKLGFDD